MTFDYADRLLKDLNRRNLRMFDKLTLMKFDELNVLKSVQSVYRRSAELAKRRYLAIALDAYIEAYMLVKHCSRDEAKKKANESITEDFIIEMLDEPDPVTLYRFDTEIERKCQRLVEALLATDKKKSEVDKALRLLSLQEAQYADESVVYGALEAYKDAGVKKVRWIAVKDSRTCTVCEKRDGHVYLITNVPPRAHWRCRCRLEPVI